MWLIDKIAEQRIVEAAKNGAFNALLRQRKAVALQDDLHVSESLRVGYCMMKNAGYIPPEIQARKELANLQQLLMSIDRHDGTQRRNLRMRVNYLLTKIGMNNAGSGSGATQNAYYEKLLVRMERGD